MLILLPPSESKTGRTRGRSADPALISFPELAAVLPKAAGRGVIVDCRSSTYAAAWAPQGDLAARWAQIRVRLHRG